jgi:hypothetical protein
LEAQQMLIKARLQKDRTNSMFPSGPTSSGNMASYVVVVRQNGVVVEGKYTLGGVPSSAYDSVTCIYYNDNDMEIARKQTFEQPGSCWVKDDGISRVRKLEMQVNGIYSPPTGGFIALDGTYTPTGRPSNFGSMFGGGNSEICTTMRVNAMNMPDGQIKMDPSTGALTWSIVPKRLDANAIVRLQKVLVETSNSNVGTITVTLYARQNNAQPVPLGSFSGQANSAITGFPTDYNMDIFFFLVTMYPIYSGSVLDANQVSVSVDYCSIIGNANTSPALNGIQPYYLQNNMGYNTNQQPRMYTYFFLHCL